MLTYNEKQDLIDSMSGEINYTTSNLNNSIVSVIDNLDDKLDDIAEQIDNLSSQLYDLFIMADVINDDYVEIMNYSKELDLKQTIKDYEAIGLNCDKYKRKLEKLQQQKEFDVEVRDQMKKLFKENGLDEESDE
jgi:chitinase